MNNVVKLQIKDSLGFAEKFIETIDGVMSVKKEDDNTYIIELDEGKRDQEAFLDVLRDAQINYTLEDTSSQLNMSNNK